LYLIWTRYPFPPDPSFFQSFVRNMKAYDAFGALSLGLKSCLRNITDNCLRGTFSAKHPGNILNLKVKARLQRVGREMKLVVHNAEDRAAADPGLLRIVARAHDFQERLIQDPDLTVPAIASQERLTIGYLSRLLRLPSLSPDIVTAIIDGKHPPELSAKRLMRLALKIPTDWAEQRKLLPQLPHHLARMALFALQTGARDAVVCGLRWEWEIPVPELGLSVFEVPRKAVKGSQRARVLVCNSVAQSIVESVRGNHPEFVFVYGERRKRSKPGPMETMNNTAWQRARTKAELGDLHVHDLRHTVGMRLREASVKEETIADILWHNRRGMTAHYSMAQIVEIRDALELITDERNRFNKSLSMLVREKSPQKVPTPKTKRARS